MSGNRRKRRTGPQRLAILKAHGSACHLCGGHIHETEGFELEHVIALGLTRDDSDENLRPAHKKCHSAKTALDLAVIAKAKRIEVAHHGARAPKQKMKSRPFAAKSVKAYREQRRKLKPKELFKPVERR
jgi:5-methylcytosine-specific restriction enzyme A